MAALARVMTATVAVTVPSTKHGVSPFFSFHEKIINPFVKYFQLPFISRVLHRFKLFRNGRFDVASQIGLGILCLCGWSVGVF